MISNMTHVKDILGYHIEGQFVIFMRVVLLWYVFIDDENFPLALNMNVTAIIT